MLTSSEVPFSRVTRDRQGAAERLDAVDETEESRSLGGVGTADSVVSNREMQIGTLGVDAHLNFSRSRVFGRVRKGFGDNVVRGHLGGVRQPSIDSEDQFDGDRGAAGQRLERWTQSSPGQDRRMNPAGEFL